MRRRLAALFLAGLALAGGGMSGAAAMRKPRPGHTTVMPPPRDPDIAVREELDAARRAGTVAAYDLFIARHGNHPLAKAAQRERTVIAGRRPG